MSSSLKLLEEQVKSSLGERARQLDSALGELTLTVSASDLDAVMRELRDKPEFHFEQLIDLCGVDYLGHARQGPGRYAVIYHLLSDGKVRGAMPSSIICCPSNTIAGFVCAPTAATTIFQFWIRSSTSGPVQTGSSAKPLTCSELCLPAIPICAAC